MLNVLIIHPDDDVVMATQALDPGTPLDLGDDHSSLDLTTVDAIPFGHKIALRAIKKGNQVTKYGASIGIASQDIEPGQHVHSHNLESVRGKASTSEETPE